MLKGYFDRIKKIEGLRGNKYYIEGIKEEDFIKRLISYPDDKILLFAKARGIENMDSKRILFEKIIPETADTLKLNKEASYQDIFIALLEEVASTRNIDRFKIYTLDEFIECVKKSDIDDTNNTKIADLKNLALKIVKPIERITPITFKESILKEFEKNILDDIGFSNKNISNENINFDE